MRFVAISEIGDESHLFRWIETGESVLMSSSVANRRARVVVGSARGPESAVMSPLS
jgi:hypothetical protein